MRQQRRNLDRGYSLVEVLVTIVLFTALAGLVYGIISRTQQVTTVSGNSTMSQAQLVDAVNRVARDVSGSQRIVTAEKNRLVIEFKSTTNCRTVQYLPGDGDGDGLNDDLISQSRVSADATLSVPDPPCPDASTLTSTPKKMVVQHLNGALTPATLTVFTYFGSDSAALTAPVADTSKITRVGVDVSVLVNGRANPLRLQTSASPRTGSTPAGSESTVTVTPAPPTFPDGPSTGGCAATYRVTWNPSLGVTAYTVFVNGSQAASITDPSIQYWDLTSMAQGQSYTVQVYASGNGGTSPTAGQQVVTRCPAAPVITGTTINADSDPLPNDNQITWPNVPGATGYTIYRDGTPIDSTTNSPSGTVNWIDPNRPWGTTSSYTVTATNPGGEGASSNTVTLTQRPAPPVLSGSEGDGFNDLSWTSVPTATSYDLYRNTAGGPVLVTNTTALTYRHNSPGWASTIDYFVIAKNSVGDSLPSNTFTLLQPPGPFALTSAATREYDRYTGNSGETLGTDGGGLRVAWSASSGVSTYEIKHNWNANVVATTDSATRIWTAAGTFANATPGRAYAFTITAVAANGKTRDTAVKTVLVDPAPPRYMWAGTWCNVTHNNNGWKFGMRWEPAPFVGTSDGSTLEEWRYLRVDSMDLSKGYVWDRLERTVDVPGSSATRRTTIFGGTNTTSAYLIQNPDGYGGRYRVFNYRSGTFDFGDGESGALSVTGTKQGPDPVVCPAGQTTWDWNGNNVNVRIRNAY